ncbi:MAG: KpsF/GutQ family sugar-phosphate isomerase [Puniceicoccales bacterium]|nr:KpsF/GutQ family sugar-phosphate isomerase [Puniceicoccales bacterium]
MVDGDRADESTWHLCARRAIRLEAEALAQTADRLGPNFDAAVSLILAHRGKVIVSAVGKSGHIGKKIAATLTSTGTQAVFLHPTEALHGDFGMVSNGDPVIFLSRSGSSDELLSMIPLLRHRGCPLIAIVGDINSQLARRCHHVIEAFVSQEADPLKLVPTCSAISALAVGDGLAIALMLGRNFRAEDFAAIHPGGQLGRNLLLRVSDVFHPLHEIASLPPFASASDVIVSMTERPLGACCTVDSNGKLIGIITDGDIRRLIRRTCDLRSIVASDIHSENPRLVRPDQTVGEAIATMESGPSQVSVLPVVDDECKLLGLVRIHDTVGDMGRR